MTSRPVEFADIQGLVRFAYEHHKEACFFVLHVADAAAARKWLAKQEFASAVYLENPPATALQVAFTFGGLKALGVPPSILEAFPTDFRIGMTGDKARSRRLGDVGRNDPECWIWGRPVDQEVSEDLEKVPHLLVLAFAGRKGPDFIDLERLKASIKDQLWHAAFKELECMSTSDLEGKEPFGFKDGVSQPRPDWERELLRGLRKSDTHSKKYVSEKTIFGNLTEYTNKSALGEFLLGYPNEYARYTDRPLVSREDDPDDILPPAEDLPDRKDFGRNGTYLVMRDLAQDVALFRAYVDDPSRQMPGKDYSLAEAMVGRRKCGKPLVALQSQTIDGVGDDEERKEEDKKRNEEDKKYNQFTFRSDPDGRICPFGAHIRRANPRNADLPDGTTWLTFVGRSLGFGGTTARFDLLESARFHRILRRGREYGPLTSEQAGKDRKRDEQGLRFICLNANIMRQFEFVQNSWIANPKFNGLEEADPLLGNREELCAGGRTDTFTWPQASGVNQRYEELPAFVTVRGGAYFFMPGLRALRYICNR